jgi:hypothetical protein
MLATAVNAITAVHPNARAIIRNVVFSRHENLFPLVAYEKCSHAFSVAFNNITPGNMSTALIIGQNFFAFFTIC